MVATHHMKGHHPWIWPRRVSTLYIRREGGVLRWAGLMIQNDRSQHARAFLLCSYCLLCPANSKAIESSCVVCTSRCCLRQGTCKTSNSISSVQCDPSDSTPGHHPSILRRTNLTPYPNVGILENLRFPFGVDPRYPVSMLVLNQCAVRTP